MLRRCIPILGGGLVPYHEWHIKEHQLLNYEGWRILDNVPMTHYETFVEDVVGVGRHLDPIIDDPRLTHKQRVCRLYRWAIKEYFQFIVAGQEGRRANMSMKVIRQRFEKYRYVTDPAMCDMMVRVTQKYLRDTCFAGTVYYRKNPASPWSNLCGSNAMWHPDNCLVYDHWTPNEVFWYDDAKLHRYAFHHPINSGAGEMFERFGSNEELRPSWINPVWRFTLFFYAFVTLHWIGFFEKMPFNWGSDEGLAHKDRTSDILDKKFQHNLQHAIQAEERARRGEYETSHLGDHWERIMGYAVTASKGMNAHQE